MRCLFLAEDSDVMELPKVNEDLRNFFLPRKYVAPEPEVVPEVSPSPDHAPLRAGHHTAQGIQGRWRVKLALNYYGCRRKFLHVTRRASCDAETPCSFRVASAPDHCWSSRSATGRSSLSLSNLKGSCLCWHRQRPRQPWRRQTALWKPSRRRPRMWQQCRSR